MTDLGNGTVTTSETRPNPGTSVGSGGVGGIIRPRPVMIGRGGFVKPPPTVMAVVSESWIDFAGRTLLTQTYPSVGTSAGAYTTETRYDLMGRNFYSSNALGTITETLFDGLGRPTYVETGSDPLKLTVTNANVYDGNGVGDGNLTKQTQYPGGFDLRNDAPVTNKYGAPRVTEMSYDWSDRMLVERNAVQTVVSTLDNLGESTQTDTYKTSPIATFAIGTNRKVTPPPSAAHLLLAPAPLRTTTIKDAPIARTSSASIPTPARSATA